MYKRYWIMVGSTIDKQASNLTRVAIHRKWANVSPTPTPTTVAAPTHPVKRGWYQCALSSPVAFYSLFYAASQHLNYLQHGADSSDHAPTLRFSYKTKAIALINRELPRLQGQPLSDALLISILSLGAHGNKPVTRYNTDTAHNQSPLASAQMLDFYGHIDQETVHMSALRKLLAYNKGIEGIELPGLVGALQLGDILHSTITNQTPTLAPRPCTLPRPIADFADKSAYPIKSSALPTSKHALKLLETLVEARALTAALEQYTSVHILHTSNERCEVSMDDLIHSRNLIHHTLISLPAANGLWGASFALYDCIRLASRIYSDLVFFPLPAETGVREGLAVQLRQALDYISLHNGWREETEALLWCCLLGAIAAEEVAGMEGVAMRGYIRNKVGMCADVLAIQSWEDQDGVETVCEKMLWWKHVCSGRGKAVWERLQ